MSFSLRVFDYYLVGAAAPQPQFYVSIAGDLHDDKIDDPLLTVDPSPDAFLNDLVTDAYYPAGVALARKFGIPIDSIGIVTRRFTLPVESTGRSSLELPVIFNVLNLLSTPLPVIFNVVSAGLQATLPVQFAIKATITPLGVEFQVVPNVMPLFSRDIQQPATDVTETP